MIGDGRTGTGDGRRQDGDRGEDERAALLNQDGDGGTRRGTEVATTFPSTTGDHGDGGAYAEKTETHQAL